VIARQTSAPARGPLGGAFERRDACRFEPCDAPGVERQRMADIPVRGEADRVIYQESITFAKASPSGTMIARLLAVDAEGRERLLGEYRSITRERFPGQQDGSRPERRQAGATAMWPPHVVR
jgi:hypothetical protein